MINLLEKSNKVENSEELGRAIQNLIEDTLDFEIWNFRMTFHDFSKMSRQIIIYDSQSCRIKFSFSRERWPSYDELRIKYGRLHATTDGSFMEWQGQNCHCWHDYRHPLRFLDGINPQVSVDDDKMGKFAPQISEEFSKSTEGSKLLEKYPPAYVLALEKKIWEYYGQKLFDLFDLRKPELWEQYRNYLRYYYHLIGKETLYGPPNENVC